MNEFTPIEIPKEEVQAFREVGSCKSACEKLIKEVIKHYELADIQQSELWEALREKYNLDPNFDYELNGRKIIRIKSRLAKQFIDQLEARKSIKEWVKGIFDSKKESAK